MYKFETRYKKNYCISHAFTNFEAIMLEMLSTNPIERISVRSALLEFYSMYSHEIPSELFRLVLFIYESGGPEIAES